MPAGASFVTATTRRTRPASNGQSLGDGCTSVRDFSAPYHPGVDDDGDAGGSRPGVDTDYCARGALSNEACLRMLTEQSHGGGCDAADAGFVRGYPHAGRAQGGRVRAVRLTVLARVPKARPNKCCSQRLGRWYALDEGAPATSSNPTGLPLQHPWTRQGLPYPRLHCVGAELALEEHAKVHGSRSVMFHSSFSFDSVWLNAVAFPTLALGPDMDVRFGARPHALIAARV